MEERDFFKFAIKQCKSNKELTTLYNKIMGKDLSVDWVRKRANKYGYHIKDNIDTGGLKSEESLKWLKENKNKYETTTDLHKAYNEHFKTNVKHASFIYNLKGIIQPKKKLEYTEEETQWFKDNTINFYSREDVRKAFNERFNKDLSLDEINRKIGYMKLHTGVRPKEEREKISLEFKKKRLEKKKREKALLPKKPRVIPPQSISMFSNEQQDWLRSHSCEFNFYKDLYVAFQKEFNTKFSMEQVKGWCLRHKLKLAKFFIYTKEEIKWVCDNYNGKLSYTELAKEFEKVFDKKMNPHSLKTICGKNKVYKDKENYVDNTPRLPVGTERTFNGRVYIKINDVKGKKGNHRAYHTNWTDKSRYVWEQANGKIPENYKIAFKDGNRENCELENLYLLNQSELNKLTKNKVYGYNEYTEAYLDIIRLEKELLSDKK